MDSSFIIYKFLCIIIYLKVVMDSVTTADIQKEAGGVSEIFNERTLANWLKQKNPSGLNKKNFFL